MSYSLMSYPELLEEIERIRLENLDALYHNDALVEDIGPSLKDNDLEQFVQIFDGYRVFFNQTNRFLEEIKIELDRENVTLGLIERMARFGDEAFEKSITFPSRIDKIELNSIAEFKNALNKWYELVGNNLRSIRDLEQIAYILNTNFRHIKPLNEVGVDNIAVQRGGISITKDDQVYIDEKPVRIDGQRRKILLLLAAAYIQNLDLSVSWMRIEEEIRIDDIIEKNKVVDRVSSVRTRLRTQGFDESVIEIRNTVEGVDAAWKLVKK